MQAEKRMRLFALLLAALMLLCAGCASKTTPAPEGSNATSAPAPEGSDAMPAPVNEDVKVETSYGTLTIPFAFTDIITVDQEKTDNTESYVFSAVLNDQKAEAYTITFAPEGTEAKGDLFGTLTKAEGGPVNVFFSAADPDESLDTDTLEVFFAAQETINHVFDSLRNIPGFTEG